MSRFHIPKTLIKNRKIKKERKMKNESDARLRKKEKRSGLMNGCLCGLRGYYEFRSEKNA